MGQYNTNVPNFLEHIKYLDSLGFVPFDIIELHYSGTGKILIQIDIIFINKNSSINTDVQNIIDKWVQHKYSLYKYFI